MSRLSTRTATPSTRLPQCHLAEHLLKHKAVGLGSPIMVINNSIVCLEMKNTEIKLGDTLIATTGNGDRPYMMGPIQELQVNNQQQQRVVATPSVNVGARVLFKAKQNYQYSLVPL